MGAACIASSLKADSFVKNNCEVLLSDFSLEDDSLRSLCQEEIAKKIAGELCQDKELFALCLSVYVWNRTLLESVIKEVKVLSPKTFCIAGGPEITANPQSFLVADFCVTGEGEVAVPALVKCLLKNESKISIQGVYKTGSEKCELEKGGLQRACSPNLSGLSSPWLDGTLSSKKYGGVLWELARGCPFKCSYCYESRGEKIVRRFPLERVQKELERFAKENVPQVFVLDPTYNANKKEALNMLRLIKKITPHTFYYFEARAEFIDAELAAAFSQINCSLQFGLQSAHPEVLKLVNRSLERKTFSRNIGLLNKTGVTFGFDLIYGLPGDTLGGFKESIDFALSLYPNNLELFCLSVLPGTDLSEKAHSLGLTFQNVPPYHVIKTQTLSEKEIEKERRLSFATNVFYTQGRAVPWFNSLIHSLHQKPSAFLSDFEIFLAKKGILFDESFCPDFKTITALQIEFASQKLDAKNKKLIPVCHDVIELNASLSEALANGKESIISLSYHPDDLMSEYASDFNFFSQNARMIKNRTKVFCTNHGVDWKVIH